MTFHHGIVNYLTSNCWLDHWTATHMAAGALYVRWLNGVELLTYGQYYG